MRQEPFDIEAPGGDSSRLVSGALRLPDGEPPWAAVAICGDLTPAAGAGDATPAASFVDDVVEALSARGIATACFLHRGDAIDEALVGDALAVVRWLLERSDLDRGRIGLLGCGTGAIAAAEVASREPGVCALGLVAPALPAGGADGLDPLSALAHAQAPTFVIRGASDRVVSEDDARQYVEAIEDAGRVVESVLVPLADHAFAQDERRVVCLDLLNAFFAGMKPAAAAS